MSTFPALTLSSKAVPGENLGAYISHVNQIPILTPAEEKELADRYFYEEDVDAARQLVMSHLRFVVHIARSYSGYGLPQGDLIQEGNVGLMKAVKRFDPSMGVRLVSFAVHWIKAEIHEYVIRNWRMVKIATTKAQRKLFFNLRSMKKSTGQLTVAEANSIAEALNVTPADVFEMQGRLTSPDASLELHAEDEENGKVAPIQFLENHIADPAQMVEDEDYEQANNTALYSALADLDDRAKYILKRRWLDDDKATLHQLADELSISAERVRQLEKSAMDKVKGKMQHIMA